MTSRYASREMMGHLLAGMMPENREAVKLSMDYGMRIGDVLAMPYDAPDRARYTYREEKTGKKRTVRLSEKHKATLRQFRRGAYCFPHRTDDTRHRCRQTVWADIKRISKAYRLRGISPHSARKLYAVELYRKTGDMERVKRSLNHDDPAVTALYALADLLTIDSLRNVKRSRRR